MILSKASTLVNYIIISPPDNYFLCKTLIWPYKSHPGPKTQFTLRSRHVIIGAMYNEFYHFKENPFSMTADPEFFFASAQHTEASAHLIYGIQQRSGIMVVTGEIGTGKTTLCRTFLNRLDNHVKTAFILNPYFSELQLLQLIVKDLGIEGKYKNKLDLIDALNVFLLQQAYEGNNVVLIIDEAQNLKPRQLEQIRLLSNLETEKTKLLQIVLVGQPELLEKLKLSSLRQLTQRISVRFHILPLEEEDTEKYVHHRLQIANRTDNGKIGVHFTDGAINALYDLTHGTPRLINILCDRALLSGFVLGVRTIDEQIIYKSAQEVHFVK